MSTIAGTYPAPVALGSARFPWATVSASVSDRGTIRLEQDGQHVLLTPTELRALVALADAA